MIDRRTIRTGLKVIAAVDSDVAGALGEAGLSRRKAEYATGLARTILDGRFDPATLAGLGDNEAIAAICTLHGFGRWSAEIYVMFSLQRPDVFPADDLALQRALQNLKGWSKRPGRRSFTGRRGAPLAVCSSGTFTAQHRSESRNAPFPSAGG